MKKLLAFAKEHQTIKVANDQFGSPTSASDLAKLIVELIQTSEYGTYHVTANDRKQGNSDNSQPPANLTPYRHRYKQEDVALCQCCKEPRIDKHAPQQSDEDCARRECDQANGNSNNRVHDTSK